MAAKKTSRAKTRKTVTRAKATRKSTTRTGRKSPGGLKNPPTFELFS